MSKRVPFLDDVPRGIQLSRGVRPWSCHCGELDNWLCRPQCKNCGREQPAHIAANARRIAERTRRERAERRSPSRGQSRGRSRERRGYDKSSGDSKARMGGQGSGGKRKSGGGNGGGGGGGGGGGSGGGGNSGSSSSSSYAEVARRTDDLRRQLAAEKKEKEKERKEKEALARKLAAATSKDGDGGGGGDSANVNDDGDDDAATDAARDMRLQQLQAAIEALEPVVEADDPKLLSLRSEKESLAKARREGKPLKTQLLALDRKLGKKREALKRTEAKCSEAWATVERSRKEAEELDKEHSDLTAELDALEAEKRDILRRELEGEDGSRADDLHWEGTVGAIRTRLHLPGVDAALSSSIAATLETLRIQCLQLPAAVPAAARAAAAAGADADGAAAPPADPPAPAAAAAPPADPKPPSPSPALPSTPPFVLAPHAKAGAIPNVSATAAAAVTVPTSDVDKDMGTVPEDYEMEEADELFHKLPERKREQLTAMFRRRFAKEGGESGTQRERERSPRPRRGEEDEDRQL